MKSVEVFLALIVVLIVATKDHRVRSFMANLLVRVKIMPREAEIKPQQVVEDIRKLNPTIEIRSTKEDPIAFGLVALIADFITDDEAGAMDSIENSIKKSELVGEFEVLGASRISAQVKK
jgi:elongation factor 1-beta